MRTLLLSLMVLMVSASVKAADTAHAGAPTVDPAVSSPNTDADTQRRILAAMEKACAVTRPDFSKTGISGISLSGARSSSLAY